MINLVPATVMLQTACFYLQLKLYLRGFCSLKTPFPPLISVSAKEHKDPSSIPENLTCLNMAIKPSRMLLYPDITLLLLPSIKPSSYYWETGTQ